MLSRPDHLECSKHHGKQSLQLLFNNSKQKVVLFSVSLKSNLQLSQNGLKEIRGGSRNFKNFVDFLGRPNSFSERCQNTLKTLF